jgi:hypothetical protein
VILEDEALLVLQVLAKLVGVMHDKHRGFGGLLHRLINNRTVLAQRVQTFRIRPLNNEGVFDDRGLLV